MMPSDSLAVGILALPALLFALIWVLASPLLSATVAEAKGHSGLVWLLAGLIFGPLAVIAIVGMPDLDREAILARRGARSKKQICSVCDEAVSAEASVCKWCDADLGKQDDGHEAD